MTIQNVSSPFRCENSDWDIQIVMNTTLWIVVTKILLALGIAHMKRERVARIAILIKMWAFDVELFLLDANNIDSISKAAYENNCTMRAWDKSLAESYLNWKVLFQDLTGHDRKVMKAKLGLFFGLNPIPWTQGLPISQM